MHTIRHYCMCGISLSLNFHSCKRLVGNSDKNVACYRCSLLLEDLLDRGLEARTVIGLVEHGATLSVSVRVHIVPVGRELHVV